MADEEVAPPLPPRGREREELNVDVDSDPDTNNDADADANADANANEENGTSADASASARSSVSLTISETVEEAQKRLAVALRASLPPGSEGNADIMAAHQQNIDQTVRRFNVSWKPGLKHLREVVFGHHLESEEGDIKVAEHVAHFLRFTKGLDRAQVRNDISYFPIRIFRIFAFIAHFISRIFAFIAHFILRYIRDSKAIRTHFWMDVAYLCFAIRYFAISQNFIWQAAFLHFVSHFRFEVRIALRIVLFAAHSHSTFYIV